MLRNPRFIVRLFLYPLNPLFLIKYPFIFYILSSKSKIFGLMAPPKMFCPSVLLGYKSYLKNLQFDQKAFTFFFHNCLARRYSNLYFHDFIITILLSEFVLNSQFLTEGPSKDFSSEVLQHIFNDFYPLTFFSQIYTIFGQEDLQFFFSKFYFFSKCPRFFVLKTITIFRQKKMSLKIVKFGQENWLRDPFLNISTIFGQEELCFSKFYYCWPGGP